MSITASGQSKPETQDEEHFKEKAELMKSQEPSNLSLDNFNIKSILGRGAYGKVYLAELPENRNLYAIKAIRKDVLLEKNNVKGSFYEQTIMLKVDHPNLASMKFIF